MSDPTAATGLPPGRARKPRYTRKLSNYLLDKKLQLRYVLLVTILSGLIAGVLGYMIYEQKRNASESIERELQMLTQSDASQRGLQEEVNQFYASEDRALLPKMAGVGIALVVILSAYLVLMTHKVAGPLYKVSMYFDRMAVGKLGKVSALRSGDMLQDFYASFQEMHEAVRAQAVADAGTMERAVAALRASQNQADYRGEARAQLNEALDQLDSHVAARKDQLS